MTAGIIVVALVAIPATVIVVALLRRTGAIRAGLKLSGFSFTLEAAPNHGGPKKRISG